MKKKCLCTSCKRRKASWGIREVPPPSAVDFSGFLSSLPLPPLSGRLSSRRVNIQNPPRERGDLTINMEALRRLEESFLALDIEGGEREENEE